MAKKFSKYSLIALVMSVVVVLLETMEKLDILANLWGFNQVIVPILFALTLVCLFLSFKEGTAFKNKWVWLPIAFLATFVLEQFLTGVMFIRTEFKFVSFITTILHFIGYGALLVAFLKEECWKVLSLVGFGVLALASLIGVEIIFVILFASLLFLALGRFAKIRPLLRWVVIILALVGLDGAIYNALLWIVVALLLVPIKKVKLDFGKVIAILCIVLVVCSALAVFDGYYVEELEKVGEEITYLKNELDRLKTVEEYEADIVAYNAQLNDLEKKRTELQRAVDVAELNLDDVCSSWYFSSWWGCDSVCRPYHLAVDAAETKVNNCEREISSVKGQISKAEDKIDRVEFIKREIPNLRAERTVPLLGVFGGILAIVGLVLLAVVFWKKNYGKLALIAGGLVGLSSALSIFVNGQSFAYWYFDLLNYPIYRIVLTVGFFGLLIVATFAGIFAKLESRPVKLRVLAIILTTIFAVLSADMLNAYDVNIMRFVCHELFVLIAILSAIYLVPFRFCEYNSIGKHIFWTLITAGIWHLIWVFHVTKNLNRVAGIETRKPWAELLLYIFLPFYSVYWYYKTAEYVDAFAAEKGKKSNLAILSLVFGLVFPVVPYVVLQDKINLIVGKPV